MSRVQRVYGSIRKEPFIAIEFVWAIALLLNGVYLVLPSYEPVEGSILAAVTTAPVLAVAVGTLYLITGLIALIGLFIKPQHRKLATMLFFVCFTFTFLIRILTVGFPPTAWLWPLLLGLTAGIDNLHLSWKQSQP